MNFVWWLCLFAYLGFSAFTFYCFAKENFWKSCKYVWARLWGIQVTIDLFLGLFLFHIFVYLREGSLIMTLCWLVPSLIFGNFVPLLYILLRVIT